MCVYSKYTQGHFTIFPPINFSIMQHSKQSTEAPSSVCPKLGTLVTKNQVHDGCDALRRLTAFYFRVLCAPGVRAATQFDSGGKKVVLLACPLVVNGTKSASGAHMSNFYLDFPCASRRVTSQCFVSHSSLK